MGKQCKHPTEHSTNVTNPSYIYFTKTHASTCNHATTDTHKQSFTSLSLTLSVSCSATSLSFAPTSWVPGLVGRKRSVDNCLLLPCHQTTLSHFTASLILRHPCQEMTFNFHTSSLCYSFFHEFYFWAHPKCIGCLAVSISLTVWESLTQMNTPTVFVFLPLTMYYD